jgi:hypothetical protein
MYTDRLKVKAKEADRRKFLGLKVIFECLTLFGLLRNKEACFSAQNMSEKSLL